MDFVHDFQMRYHEKIKKLNMGGLALALGLNSETNFVIIRLPHSWVLKLTNFVIIRLPHSWVLKLVSRAVLFVLALVIVSFFCLNSIIGGFTANFHGANSNSDLAVDTMNTELLPLFFRDLANEGLLKTGDRAVFLSNGNEEAIDDSQFLRDNEMDLISYSDSERQSLIPDETFDFALTHGFHGDSKFIDRALKVGGIAAIQLSDNPMVAFQKPSNYKIVYLRKFDSTLVAMRKTSNGDTNSPTQRKLCGLASEAKKAALKKLEDVLLEPPRAASGRSNTYLKKTRYLPDLMGDSLESYPRRVFINVGLPDKNDWFAKHYPTRNKDFEIYKIETVTEESSGREVPQIGMSDWLGKTVKENEYVVMKAEAEVVEEMMKSKSIRLVDELFLECKHQGIKKGGRRNRRAYWECLALYGRLRDEGVAVHQWWG
ncbi:unnamed protein product [Ilex paraguariensis]|uniref:DUF7870 domain-containing protein n=1 Tax=Ilex paraguariensis TaxID=185542 RepID=A0ABC8UZV0_9AQUA